MAVNIRRVIPLLLTVLVVAGIVYGFLFGPLFPYSPIKPGFSTLKLDRCDIVYPDNTRIAPEYATLEQLIQEAEQFHHLRFKERVQVILCATNAQHKRFSMSGGHACTTQTGTVVYIRPSIETTAYPPRQPAGGNYLSTIRPSEETRRDLTGFLKHELSHALLYQNTSLRKAFKLKRWIEEGVAVYFGNPDHYYQGAELRYLAIDQGYFFNLLNDDSEPTGIPGGIKHYFTYGMFREFMDYLIQTYGLESVLAYIHEYIEAPAEEEDLFESHFGASLMDMAGTTFRSYVSEM